MSNDESRDASVRLIRGGRAIYAPYEGIPELRGAIASVLARDGLTVDPERELVVVILSTWPEFTSIERSITALGLIDAIADGLG